MAGGKPIQGELQARIMRGVWRLGEATVEQARSALPPAHRGAYNTVQTVLNRLAERGLLTREQRGRGIVYRPTVSEADYLSGTIAHTLAGASAAARQAALARIIGSLEASELSEVQSLGDEVRAARATRRR